MALTDVLGKGPRPGPDTKERQRRVVRRRKRNQFGMDWGGPVEKKKKKKRGEWEGIGLSSWRRESVCVCAGERASERAGQGQKQTHDDEEGKGKTLHVPRLGEATSERPQKGK
jgi:hypothetical protein